MRFFLYEFVTGGGWWSVDRLDPPSGSLLNEGSAMLESLIQDFAQLGSILTLRDDRCRFDCGDAEVRQVTSALEERHYFAECVQAADWTVVIAPEFDEHLLTRCRWVEQLEGRLLGPGTEFVSIAGDKEATARRLAAAGVRVPRGFLLSQLHPSVDHFPFPGVLKPRDGAGSMDVRLVRSWQEVQSAADSAREYRLEEFHAGIAASVSVLAGPQKSLILPACRQHLSCDDQFRYLGGEGPLPAQYCERAERLARAVTAAFPTTIGYFGIDLVFGSSPDGSDDVVIEVNPRFTTSYLGLRRIAQENLAEAIMHLANGLQVQLSFDAQPVQFAASVARQV